MVSRVGLVQDTFQRHGSFRLCGLSAAIEEVAEKVSEPGGSKRRG
jgi:hypothetical protein